MARRWKKRPEGSNWGEFGDDDQLGRLNYLTPEKVKQGVAEVKEGLTFCLSLPLNLPGGNKLNPRRHPPVLRPTERDGLPYMNFPASKLDPHFEDVICDDAVLLWTQYSTQWDSFAHVGCLFDADDDGVPEVVYYNGFRGHEHVKGPMDYLADKPTGVEYKGADALGIDNFAVKGMQGRGVLIDLRAHFGDARKYVGYDDLMRVMEADGVEVEKGDMVLFNTGFSEHIVNMRGQPDEKTLHSICCVLDGRDEKLLQWVTDSGVAALISDNYAVEGMPAKPSDKEKHPMLPLHNLCLFKLGIPLGEIWWTTDLARWLREHKRSRFLLTAPPLRLPGAVGSPATPIATV